MKLNIKRQNGFGLIEIIIGASIISISIVAIMGVFQNILNISGNSLRLSQASFLAEEGAEVTKLLRDESWSQNIATKNIGTRYFLDFSTTSSKWSFTTSTNTIDSIFYRWVTFEDVYRDIITEDIDNSGVLDTDTKKINVNISWRGRSGTSTYAFTTYIVNLFDN